MPGESWDQLVRRHRAYMRTQPPSLPNFKIKDRSGYHPGLARYPNDPQAYVDGSHSLQRRVSQRLREGWERGGSYGDAINDAKGEQEQIDRDLNSGGRLFAEA